MPGKQIPSSLECLHQPSKLIAVCFILRELDIYPLNFIMSFPPSVQCSRGQTSPHTGQGPSWVLSSQPIYCNLCSSSTNEITTDEQLKITPIMQASCNNFPYKIYTSTPPELQIIPIGWAPNLLDGISALSLAVMFNIK